MPVFWRLPFSLSHSCPGELRICFVDDRSNIGDMKLSENSNLSQVMSFCFHCQPFSCLAIWLVLDSYVIMISCFRKWNLLACLVATVHVQRVDLRRTFWPVVTFKLRAGTVHSKTVLILQFYAESPIPQTNRGVNLNFNIRYFLKVVCLKIFLIFWLFMNLFTR